MSLGKFLNDTVEKAAKEQLQEKAMDVAGEVIKKAMGGGDGNKEEKKKDSGIDVGSIVKNVTGGKDSNKGGGLAGSLGSILNKKT